MRKRKIVVIGGGGHAKSLISVIKKSGGFKIVGYVDVRDQGKILNVPWIGTDADLKSLKEKQRCSCVAIGVGSIDVSHKRQNIYDRMVNFGFELPTIIAPTAVINEDVAIGLGTVVFDGAIVNSGSRIGRGCILNTGCVIDHDCDIGDFVHIAPGVILSGGVKIGDHCLLGTGCKVIQYKTISRDCLVGAGAVVVKDLSSPGTYVGIPACLMECKVTT